MAEERFEKLTRLVSKELNIPIDEIRRKNKEGEVVWAKSCCIHLCALHSRGGINIKIAKYFNFNDTSGAWRSRNRVMEVLKEKTVQDKHLSQQVQELVKKSYETLGYYPPIF